jgi:hypothetical protein
MGRLDAEWARGEGVRGAVVVRSGGNEYLIDTSQSPMTQVAIQDYGDFGGGAPQPRRVRRRQIEAFVGPLAGRGEVCMARVDAGLSGRGDTVIVPQSYVEHASTMFKVGRRNRAAVYRISLDSPGARRGGGARAGRGGHSGAAAAAAGAGEEAEPPPPLWCGGVEFVGQERCIALPPWMAQALGLDDNGERPRLRVEPWLLPTVKGVTLKSLSPGFAEAVREMASEAAGADFDVTTVLSLPMSQHYTTLTQGSMVPIVCGDGGRAFDFLVVALSDSAGEAVAAVDIKSVFHAEIELDMEYLDDDIQRMVDTLGISPDRARQSLTANGFDLLVALKAEEAQVRWGLAGYHSSLSSTSPTATNRALHLPVRGLMRRASG